MTFVKTAAYQFQQLRLKKMTEEREAELVGCTVLPAVQLIRYHNTELIVIKNTDQSNLAKGIITVYSAPRSYLPGDSIPAFRHPGT